MMNFTLSNQVQIPAVGIGTFMMTPDQAEQAVVEYHHVHNEISICKEELYLACLEF